MRYKLALTGAAVLAAFLLATNPVVVHAAKQITGAGIRNSSITGVDIRNNSLTGADLRDGSLTAGDLPIRVAAVATEGNALNNVTAAPRTMLTTSIAAPAAGFLVISASADVYNNAESPAVTSCWLAVDGAEKKASRRKVELNADCASDVTVPVAKGSHRVDFRANADVAPGDVTYGVGSLNVIFVPTGSARTIPAPAARPSLR